MTKNAYAPRLTARKALALLALSLLAVALAPARARAQWTQPTPPDTNIHNTNDGNVGIGTGATVPAERLVTMGNILGGNITAHTKLYPTYDSQNNSIFELGYGTPTAGIVPLANFVPRKNLTSANNVIGALSFANSSIPDGNEKRVAAILGWTDLTTTSGSLRFYVTNGGTFAEKMRLAPSGFLGLGTSSPLNLLHVDGGGVPGQLRVSGTGLAALNLKDYAGGTDAKFYQLRTDSSLFRLSLINDSELAFVRQNILVANSAGNVGLGTDDASDLSFKLALKTDAANDGMLLKSSATWSFFAANLGEGSYNSITKGGDRGIVYGGNTAGSPGGGFVIAPWASATSGLRVDASGNVGIGTSAPGARLDVSGGYLHIGGVCGGALPNAQGAYLSWNQNCGTGETDLINHQGLGTGGFAFMNTANGSTLTTLMSISGTGDVTVGGAINARYQDVAEWVPSTQKLSAGTVVVLDPERSNHVLASTISYDTKVAGVVSGRPGITLGEG
jgi:hypothetical protein